MPEESSPNIGQGAKTETFGDIFRSIAAPLAESKVPCRRSLSKAPMIERLEALTAPCRARDCNTKGRNMTGDYKLYCIGDDGHIKKRHDYAAPDDLAALNQARKICGPHEVEVWERARFVARVKADGTTSDVQSKGPHAD